jgi:chemotaxis protein methyltransferase CheR
MSGKTNISIGRRRDATEIVAADRDDAEREFEFSDADFKNLVQLAYTHTGISLADSKRNLVYSRVSRRLRALGLTSFRDYRQLLGSPEGDSEIEGFINSISTNLTKLFRESHHFDHFQANVAKTFARSEQAKPGGRLRVWSAGCSTGEEPYTIAMVLKGELPKIGQQDARILATDIDTDVLAKAKQGEYPDAALQEVPAVYRNLMQPNEENAGPPTIVMDDELRSLISFRQLNLLKPWPFHGLFDAIFCRNVMIYFDGPTKEALIDRFIAQLKPKGWLYIGHSESLHGTHPHLQLVGRTIYRRAE